MIGHHLKWMLSSINYDKMKNIPYKTQSNTKIYLDKLRWKNPSQPWVHVIPSPSPCLFGSFMRSYVLLWSFIGTGSWLWSRAWQFLPGKLHNLDVFYKHLNRSNISSLKICCIHWLTTWTFLNFIWNNSRSTGRSIITEANKIY